MKRIALVLVPLVALGASASVSQAAPKPKPIKKTYQAPTLDQAKHEAPFEMPWAGTLQVDLNGFQGDWALAILDSKGAKIADHDNDVSEPIDTPSKIVIKVKKKTALTIRACNFAGGPTATVTILATPK
jgi:hypothetical protein